MIYLTQYLASLPRKQAHTERNTPRGKQLATRGKQLATRAHNKSAKRRRSQGHYTWRTLTTGRQAEGAQAAHKLQASVAFVWFHSCARVPYATLSFQAIPARPYSLSLHGQSVLPMDLHDGFSAQ